MSKEYVRERVWMVKGEGEEVEDEKVEARSRPGYDDAVWEMQY